MDYRTAFLREQKVADDARREAKYWREKFYQLLDQTNQKETA